MGKDASSIRKEILFPISRSFFFFFKKKAESGDVHPYSILFSSGPSSVNIGPKLVGNDASYIYYYI